MRGIFQNLTFDKGFLNDILIFNNDKEYHKDHLETVLGWLSM